MCYVSFVLFLLYVRLEMCLGNSEQHPENYCLVNGLKCLKLHFEKSASKGEKRFGAKAIINKSTSSIYFPPLKQSFSSPNK